jgi:predicted small integral membrane protein
MHTGADRLFLALLTSAYREEEVDGEKRTGRAVCLSVVDCLM